MGMTMVITDKDFSRNGFKSNETIPIYNSDMLEGVFYNVVKTNVTYTPRPLEEGEESQVNPYNGHDYVEIGGLKWATKNVGANSITDAGLYFRWGDTQGYTPAQCINGDFTINYKYYDGENWAPTSEFSTNYPNYGDSMLSSDDPATVLMGSGWRTPSDQEWLSLTDNADVTFTVNYNNSNIPGYIFTDKLDNTKVLFLPALYAYDGFTSDPPFPYSTTDIDYNTHYWTSLQTGEGDGYAQYFYPQAGENDNEYEVIYDSEALYPVSIYYGLPIRAVTD